MHFHACCFAFIELPSYHSKGSCLVSKSFELIKYLLGDDIITEIEHGTHRKKIAMKLLDNLHLLRLFPPLRDLLPALAASLFEPPTHRLTLIEKFIIERGLLSRVWIKDTATEELLGKTIKLIQDLSHDTLLKILAVIMKNYATTSELESRLDHLIDMTFTLYARAGKFDLTAPKLFPSPKFLSEITKCKELEANPDEIINEAIRTTCRILPKRLLSYLDFALRILTGISLRELSSNTISKLLFSERLEAIKIVCIIAMLYAGSFSPDRLREQIRLSLLEFLIREYITSNDNMVHGWLISLLLTVSASREELLNLLTIYKLASVHGGKVMLRLLETLFENSNAYLIACMLMLLTAHHNDELEAISSLAISRNSTRLRLINSILIKSDLKPHGLTAPIPWELYGSIDKLLRSCKSAITYYKNLYIQPPRNLLRLDKFLESANNMINLELEETTNIEELKQKLELTLETLSRGYAFTSEMIRTFGMLPGFFQTINAVRNTCKKLSDRWEYTLTKDYLNLVTKHRDLFTISSLDAVQREQEPIISLIIDGLRFDDLILRLLPKLKKRGFRLIQGGAKISLLPSITTVSRRAIISGELPQLLAFSKTSLKREDEILLGRFGQNIESYYGPVATVYSKFSEREYHSNKVFIVLSELEKSMHGSSEKILAHFVDEYLHSIVELIMYLVTSITRKHKKIRILICSDHGLSAFVKFYDLSIFLEKLTNKKLTDPSLEPLIKERFALIPLRNPQQILEAQQIYSSEEEFRYSFWLLPADSLGFKEIEFYLKGTKTLAKTCPSSRVVIIFPKGDRKLISGKGAIYHGGLSPDETFSAYALLSYDA